MIGGNYEEGLYIDLAVRWKGAFGEK